MDRLVAVGFLYVICLEWRRLLNMEVVIASSGEFFFFTGLEFLRASLNGFDRL